MLGRALLVAVLVGRKRYAAFPLFSSYAVMLVIKSLVLFWYSFHDEQGDYFYAYYQFSILESLWMIAVAWEVFDKVFSKSRMRRAGLLRGFFVAYGFTAGVALGLATANIHAHPVRVMAYANGLERAATFVAFGTFAATAFFSTYLKLPWRPHAFGIGAGFLLTLSVDSVFAAVLASQLCATVEVLRYVPMFGFLLAEIAWIQYLRRDEPELRSVGWETIRELRAFLARAEIPRPDQKFAKSNTVND